MPRTALEQALADPPEILRLIRHIPGLYLVGGYLRDAWWERTTKDIDLAFTGPAEPLLAELRQLLGADSFELNKRFASHRLQWAEWEVDLTPLHPEGLAADIARRDYTVNALAVPLAALGGGRELAAVAGHPATFADLEAGRLRMVSAENLAADPVRILRGYRLAATHRLSVDAETRQAWRGLAGRIHESAAERLHEELLRTFATPDIAGVVADCGADGVLWELFPALQDTAVCEQNHYHDRDTWRHTLDALQALDGLYRELPSELEEWRNGFAAAWEAPVSRAATAGTLTRLALLLHDMGKPMVREVQPDGRVTFHNHQDIGAEQAGPLLDGLKFATAERDFVVLLIKEHLRLGFYSDHLPLTSRLVYRFLKKFGPWTPLAVLHALADCRATSGWEGDNGWERHVSAAGQLLDHYFSRSTTANPPLYLDGNEIMALLGLRPSRMIGALKNALLEATAAGEVNDRAGAEAFLREKATGMNLDCN